MTQFNLYFLVFQENPDSVNDLVMINWKSYVIIIQLQTNMLKKKHQKIVKTNKRETRSIITMHSIYILLKIVTTKHKNIKN